jgi:hypothetical protein
MLMLETDVARTARTVTIWVERMVILGREELKQD